MRIQTFNMLSNDHHRVSLQRFGWPRVATLRRRARIVPSVLFYGVVSHSLADSTGQEETRDERDWALYETILSGNIGVVDDSTDNSYHVVVANAVDRTAEVNGFTISHGMAIAPNSPENLGAGILSISGSPTLRNIQIIRNESRTTTATGGVGGAIYVEDGSPLIEDCLIDNNRANSGVVAFIRSDPTMRRVTIRRNEANQLFFVDNSAGVIEDAVIEDGGKRGVIISRSNPNNIQE